MATTPDGTYNTPKDPANYSECWITDNETYGLAKIKANTEKEPYLQDYIVDACAEINRICKRKFNKQTIDKIFKNQDLLVSHYITLVLDNVPIESVTNAWLQTADNFTPINTDFFQIMFDEGVVKAMPKNFFLAYSSIPPNLAPSSSNLWVRYVGGYDIADVPRPVKRATALMVEYLFGFESLDVGLKSFRTQTYSETYSGTEDDPVLSKIKHMLKDYINYTTA